MWYSTVPQASEPLKPLEVLCPYIHYHKPLDLTSVCYTTGFMAVSSYV